MDWKTMVATFALVFMAELGDKTQLATMMLAAEMRSRAAVFAGAAVALLLSSLIGVLAGDVVSRLFPVRYLQTAAGLAFVAIGLLLVSGKI